MAVGVPVISINMLTPIRQGIIIQQKEPRALCIRGESDQLILLLYSSQDKSGKPTRRLLTKKEPFFGVLLFSPFH